MQSQTERTLSNESKFCSVPLQADRAWEVGMGMILAVVFLSSRNRASVRAVSCCLKRQVSLSPASSFVVLQIGINFLGNHSTDNFCSYIV